MQLVGRVFILAVCVLSAFAVPKITAHFESDVAAADGIYQMILAQVRSASMIDTRAMTIPEAVCADQYNNKTQSINNVLTNQTNACFENANKTTNGNALSANDTANIIRANLRAVQNQLANCSAIENITEFNNCTTATFDNNLLQLNAANSQAYLLDAQISVNGSQVDIIRNGCINAAIGGAKTNLTTAANDYNKCLYMAKNQRDAPSNLLLN
ncbi:uncharacterized protein LOC119681669 [Teleopsis dalmanni]|uniref:uncharacterized protein LOC119681669 n=1 Tax=Teleopsis dalmanni TaxID=139649 RepID=UPI0018CE5457|nr:uncharacterized protein LOC119681669 [Teleopsis dalmanni]